MDFILNRLESADGDEDDYGSYFLQPASSPYNIAEKVQQANIDLLGHQTTMQKTSKVTFRDDLASYEPELLTDDDINSLESDPAVAESLPDPLLEYKSSNSLNLDIYDIIDEDDEVEEILDEIDSPLSPNEEKILTPPGSVDTRPRSSRARDVSPPRRKRTRRKSPHPAIQCRSHCIERLDFDLSMSIKKLEIREKPPECPLLKLQRRPCCEESRQPSLPAYRGLRSEYGLSSSELVQRERRQEILRLKEQKRRQLLGEYRSRKNQQNEAVFCQWLKDVARRKAQRQTLQEMRTCKAPKESLSPHVVSFPDKGGEKTRERPKTANEFHPRQNIKRARRPHTSSACVFIEVPHKLLENGISIRDLLVANSGTASRKMHIFAISP